MIRCEKCDLPIEPEDLLDEENPDDPLTPLYYHCWCHPDFREINEQPSTVDVDG